MHRNALVLMAMVGLGWPLTAQEELPLQMQTSPTREHPLTVTNRMSASNMRVGGPDTYKERTQSAYHCYRMAVPPKQKLKARLKSERSSAFKVMFVTEEGNPNDPGLIQNRVNYLQDVSFFANTSSQPRNVFCYVIAREDMDKLEYTLTFTDF